MAIKNWIFSLGIIILSMTLTASHKAQAQEARNDFYVASFKELDMDLDARLYPETDENGKKAALIKIVTGERGFSFDVGIMGIVGTRQEVGEIWVYVPESILRITIRHKDFGVIRDYVFGIPIKSAYVYELVLHTPERGSALKVSDKAATGISPVSSVNTGGLAVPTFQIARRRPVKKWLVNAEFGIVPDFSAGLMAGRTYTGTEKGRGGGWYLKARSDFRFQTRYDYECLGDGTVDGKQIWTKKGGHTWRARYSVTGGAIWQCFRNIGLYGGIGYGQKSLVWEDDKELRVRVKDYSYRGLAIDFGAIVTIRKWTLSAGVSSIRGEYYDMEAGVGICF